MHGIRYLDIELSYQVSSYFDKAVWTATSEEPGHAFRRYLDHQLLKAAACQPRLANLHGRDGHSEDHFHSLRWMDGEMRWMVIIGSDE